MMAVAENRPTQPVYLSTPPLPEFTRGQTFRVQNPDKVVGDIIKVISVSSMGGTTKVYYTVNGVGVKAKTVAEFCLAFPNRVRIPG